MTTTSPLATVDANVLVYSVYPTAPQYAACRHLLDRARVPAAGLCVFPQALAEFFAVITNRRRVSPVQSPGDALRIIDSFLALPGLTVLPLPADVVGRWVASERADPVKGGDVFDRQLAAAMQAHGIATLYTYNTADFARIPGVIAVEPPPPPAP